MADTKGDEVNVAAFPSADTTSSEKGEKSQVEVGQESFGAPPDDDVEYVNGAPVIRSGKFPS